MLDMMAPSAGAGDEKPESTEKNYSTELHRLHRWFRAYETNKRREMDEQRSSRQYYHDKQWTDTEIQRLKSRGQQPTVRNRIKRKIDFLRGVEQRLRRDPKAYPRTPKHEKSADTATAALRYACDKSRWEKISSDCMSDGLIDGIGVIFVGIEVASPRCATSPLIGFSTTRDQWRLISAMLATWASIYGLTWTRPPTVGRSTRPGSRAWSTAATSR